MNRKRAKDAISSSDSDDSSQWSSSSSDEPDTVARPRRVSGDTQFLWGERRRKLRAKKEELDSEQEKIIAAKARLAHNTNKLRKVKAALFKLATACEQLMNSVQNIVEENDT
ncbi:hypothetical protein CYMTET_38646 [Cymbomonas tetramitiformis]|uniref:Uncharacterized protein n=1 Tax=Cymbomonas tetramitiformis TaxID=36881 RepID=A0AAE0EZR2_9CHLO|nr:hypothetical protein CYMTET_44301 [Cymbomonas tetramitiformis]KAK3252088.1 hypothetical protein CYMTET_38646 [Cymbomonas tetramitiformis]